MTDRAEPHDRTNARSWRRSARLGILEQPRLSAAWRHHVSICPVPEVDGTLRQELAPYRASKGTLKILRRAPAPYDLVGAVALALDQERTASTS